MTPKAFSVFGGTGFVGSNFVKQYGNTYRMYVRDRWMRRPFPGEETDTVWFISTVHNYNVHTDASLDVQTNLVTLTEALEAHRHLGGGVFNFISSWFVYGDHGGYPVIEEVGCYPKGFYSITKRCAEQLIQSYCTTFNMKYRILRLCNVVGPGDNFSAKKNALQYLINEMKEGREIKLYGGGNFFRNYMHVFDVAKAIEHVIRDPDTANQIYNIGHRYHRLFKEHIYYIRDRLPNPGKVSEMPQRAFHAQVQAESFRMNTDKLIKHTGFMPTYDLDTMMDSLIV